MKKLIALLAVALPLVGQAQPSEGQDWWACQTVENAGLIYRSGKWESTYFSGELKFILISDGNSLTTESVYKAGITVDAECRSDFDTVTCFDMAGGQLIFDTTLAQGAISQIYGGLQGGDDRDTLHVKPFECAKG